MVEPGLLVMKIKCNEVIGGLRVKVGNGEMSDKSRSH